MLFFLSAALCAVGTQAQERTVQVGTPLIGYVDASAFKAARAGRAGNLAAKTTAASPRWYSYADYFDRNETATSSSVAYFSQYLWNDTMAVMAYSGTSGTEWNHNRMVSMGIVSDLAFYGFNDVTYYDGAMKIDPSDSYVIDSVRVTGFYGFNPARTVVDTLRISFAYAAGTSKDQDVYLAKTGNPVVLSRYGVAAGDSMNTYRLHYDTVANTAGGTAIITKDILLDNTGSSPAWGDTLADGTYEAAIRLSASGVTIPAGYLVGASVSFISGDPSFSPHDTVFGSTLGYKYNMFRPFCIFRGTAGSPAFANYSTLDRNNGVFKTLPDTSNGWGGQYIPLWFWSSSGGGASTLQYPLIDFHVASCATCGTVTLGVNSVSGNAQPAPYPNPANDKLYVPFSLTTAGNVTITLTNMLGQVVATQTMGNATNGTATFNTALWADGVYTYTISTGDQRITGRVSIVH